MDFLKDLAELALGSRLKRLVENLRRDVTAVYKSQGIDFEPFLMPITNLLDRTESLQINQIADYLGISQPAVTQCCNLMNKKELIELSFSSKDQRKREISFTVKGKQLVKKLNPIWEEISAVIKEIIDSSDNNLLKAVENFENQLTNKSLKDRVEERLIKKKNLSVDIIGYKEELKKYFKNLNYEWIKKYFIIEPSDKYILQNPKEAVIDKGGHIFFALMNNKVIGTFALIKITDNIYELAKMAVAEKYQKKGIGKKLVEHAKLVAENLNLIKLVLYSHTSLAPAINLYFQAGFKVIPKEDYHNKRANIKMEMINPKYCINKE